MSNEDFDLRDLWTKLEEDESWEPDPEVRKAVVTGLRNAIIGR